MNSETQRQSLMKFLLVSGLACIAWMFLVKPATEKVAVQRETLDSHQRLIVSYEDRVGTTDSDKSLETQDRLESILERMSGTTYSGDAGTALHGLINKTAANHGVSVSRIESTKARQVTEPVMGTEESVLGMNQMVRVEVEGDYDAILAFMDGVVIGPGEVKFDSFRFMPIGHESIRVNAEISSVLLTSVPDMDTAGGLSDE